MSVNPQHPVLRPLLVLEDQDFKITEGTFSGGRRVILSIDTWPEWAGSDDPPVVGEAYFDRRDVRMVIEALEDWLRL